MLTNGETEMKFRNFIWYKNQGWVFNFGSPQWKTGFIFFMLKMRAAFLWGKSSFLCRRAWMNQTYTPITIARILLTIKVKDIVSANISPPLFGYIDRILRQFHTFSITKGEGSKTCPPPLPFQITKALHFPSLPDASALLYSSIVFSYQVN